VTPDATAERLEYLMFIALQAITTQKTAIFAASLIGLACCLAAIRDVRLQQAAEQTIDQAAGQATHHMRGWHKGRGLG
jgi:hypothetical protein